MNKIKRHNLIIDLLLTFLTLGLFNLWIQLRQILDTNELLGEERFSFFWLLVLTLLTAGFYFCYHEYKMTLLLQRKVLGQENKELAILCGLGSFLGFWIFVDSYQQSLLNQIVDQYSQVSIP